jgi:hypothetical protein
MSLGVTRDALPEAKKRTAPAVTTSLTHRHTDHERGDAAEQQPMPRAPMAAHAPV